MGSRAFDKIALTAPGMAAWGHSRRIRPACFSGACPLLPESDSQPPKCVPSLRANTCREQVQQIVETSLKWVRDYLRPA
jgi:hypothetical protein